MEHAVVGAAYVPTVSEATNVTADAQTTFTAAGTGHATVHSARVLMVTPVKTARRHLISVQMSTAAHTGVVCAQLGSVERLAPQHLICVSTLSISLVAVTEAAAVVSAFAHQGTRANIARSLLIHANTQCM